MAFSDAGHRPHADHRGQQPRNHITRGPQSLRVTLDSWGPQDNIFPAMYDALQSNWGESPERSVYRPCTCGQSIAGHAYLTWEHRTGWCRLTAGEHAYIEKCFAGQTLQQVLEALSFVITIDGCSRATTHQLVRTRIGAGFMQHGGRDNDWRHRDWTMPETVYRALRAHEERAGDTGGRPIGAHPVNDFTPLDDLVVLWDEELAIAGHSTVGSSMRSSMFDAVEWYLEKGRQLYAALVDAGVPWQDARRLLWMGTQTYIHEVYNYLALRGVLSNRLEHIMDWEINCVAQLLLREVNMKCPPLLAKYLGSASDRAGRDMFAGLESWPPVGKYPNPHEQCADCKHAKGNHGPADPGDPFHTVCEVCLRSSSKDLPSAWHEYIPEDRLPRTHRVEQNPFWVLHPDSLAGHPIIGWVATNGTYPKEFPAHPRECELVIEP